jgi:transcriptional regulator with XRE-family HTH domain
MSYNKKIKESRIAAGLTQAELGVRAFNVTPSVGQTRIKRIEHGQKFLTATELEDICTVLEMTPEEMQEALVALQSLKEAKKKVPLIERYPELGALKLYLEKGLEMEDSYILERAWKEVAIYAQTQVDLIKGSKLDDLEKKIHY